MITAKKNILMKTMLLSMISFIATAQIHAEALPREESGPLIASAYKAPQGKIILNKKDAITLSAQAEFHWDDARLDPGSEAYASSTIIVHYWISLYNVPVGDVFTWQIYRPVLDSQTYLPTGDLTLFGTATWTRTDEEYWDWRSGTTWKHYYMPSDHPRIASGPYIKDSSAVQYPGIWRITISRNGQLLTSADFNLIDDLVPTISFISPAEGAPIKGRMDIQISNSDNLGVTKIDLYADNLTMVQSYLLQSYTMPSSDVGYTWVTRDYPEGKYTLRASAYDPYNNMGTATVNLGATLSAIAAAEISAGNDVGLRGVSDPVYITAFDLEGNAIVIHNAPIGEMVNDNFDLDIVLDAYPDKPDWSPRTEWKWQISGLGGPVNGTPFTGWSASEIMTPRVNTPTARDFGDHQLKVRFAFKDNAGAAINTQLAALTLKLFFDKTGDYNQDGVPNWFGYWKSGSVVPGMDKFVYNSSSGYGEFISPNMLFLGSSAASEHYPEHYVINGVSFGGARGIDCTAEAVAHELYHKWSYDNKRKGGIWYGKIDSDGDGLPDDYELTIGTNPNNKDTFKIAEIRNNPEYADYGDEEYMAMIAGNGKKGDDTKDWAYPGKQTDPEW